MKGDFHVRIRENAGVKLPCVTRLCVILTDSLRYSKYETSICSFYNVPAIFYLLPVGQ